MKLLLLGLLLLPLTVAAGVIECQLPPPLTGTARPPGAPSWLTGQSHVRSQPDYSRTLSGPAARPAVAPYHAAEPSPLTTALARIRMSEQDLRFKKDIIESAFVLPMARQCLQDPLALPTLAQDTRRHLQGIEQLAQFSPLAAGFLGCTGMVDRSIGPSSSASIPALELPAGLPPALVSVVRRLYAAAAATAPVLPKPETAALEAFLMSTLSAKPDRAAYVPDLHQRDQALLLQDDELAKPLLEAANRLDRETLLAVFHLLCREVDTCLEELRKIRFDNVFQHEIQSPMGPIFLGGTGPNTYSLTNRLPLLIIDLGGNDLYQTISSNLLTGTSIILDLDGNDMYQAQGLGGQAAGVCGIGILVDCAGNDRYQAQHIAQGAGLFGCGLLADFAGTDQFEADTFAQGAGAFGVGILWQRAGDTRYQAAEKSQAFASTLGVGLLLDGQGQDQYRSGGKYPCRWLEGHNFSLSQGMAIGIRPLAAGGVAVLADLAGNDRYEADVYGQGASYWYSLGLLLDNSGNDSYHAYQYAQGAGIHLSSGLLWDAAGDDIYQSHAICQGGAHDYSVGLLIDQAGQDRYTADSTAQGSAINNSVALLLDRAGNDAYTGTDPKQSQAAGHDGGRRQYGSIAVLLDLGGQDTYSQGWTNNTIWTKPFYGAGLDQEYPLADPLPLAVSPVSSAAATRTNGFQPFIAALLPTVDPHHPIERLVRRASRDWDTASEKTDTESADAELKTRSREVLAYLVTRLDSPNIMLRVKAEELVDRLGTNSVPVLIDGVRTARNDEIARVCCYFLARFGSATNAIPVLMPLLGRDLTETTALYTLGHLRAQEAFGHAVTALASDREPVRLRAVQLLGRLGHPHAIDKLIPLLDDPAFPVRYATESALVALGWRSLGPLRAALSDATPRARPHIQAVLDQLKPKRPQPAPPARTHP